MKKHLLAYTLALCCGLCSCGQDIIPVRVMSYNVHNCIGLDNVRDYNRIAEVIKQADPDVVALQELDSMTQRNDGVYALKELETFTGMHGIFVSAIPFQGGSYGIGLLSKEQPLSYKKIPMPGREEQRTMLVAEFKDYVFCATHLSLTPEDQLASVREILKVVEKYHHKPVLLAGDMNSRPNEKPQQELNRYFTTLSDTTAYTFPADRPDHCIDYIYGHTANECDFKVLQQNVLPEATASDHRPVQVDVLVLKK